MPRALDQDSSHRHCRGAEEVCAALPLHARWAHQAEIRFVHQGRRIQFFRDARLEEPGARNV